MTRIQIKSRVGSDGVLTLKVPLGREEADREVIVNVESADSDRSTSTNQDEWSQFIRETAGQWQGEPLERPDQGEFEKRDEWG